MNTSKIKPGMCFISTGSGPANFMLDFVLSYLYNEVTNTYTLTVMNVSTFNQSAQIQSIPLIPVNCEYYGVGWLQL